MPLRWGWVEVALYLLAGCLSVPIGFHGVWLARAKIGPSQAGKPRVVSCVAGRVTVPVSPGLFHACA